VKAGGQPQKLIGLAFSGGGIRSATFNLGVLQGLQEFDLLRYIDYLSTVSGGGFIGSWLTANVYRTTHWLGRLTRWEESVAHLRRYSNYLAPSTGILSADTWTMWAIYLRNAFLIQLSGATWLAVLLLAALTGESVFRWAGELPLASRTMWFTPVFPQNGVPASGWFAATMTLVLVIILLYNLGDRRRWIVWWARAARRVRRSAVLPAWILSALNASLAWGRTIVRRAFPAEWVRRLAVLPAWISSFLMAGLFWGDATGRTAMVLQFAGVSRYSEILTHAWSPWLLILIVVSVAFFFIAFVTMARHPWHALWISPVSTAALYLQLCAIM
jgi:hypothetical protein